MPRLSAILTSTAVSLLCMASSAGCQQPSPRSAAEAPAARRLGELVRVVNAGNADSVRAYAAANFAPAFLSAIPLADHVEQLLGMYARTGGFAVRGGVEAGPAEASALVQAKRTELWSRIVVRVEPEPPNRIAGIGMRPASDPAAPARKLTDAEVVAQLKAYVEKLARNDDFSGTVLLARAGTVLYSAAFGEANKDFGVPNRLDTKFNLGSMNKMFTAVAVAQLAEQGKLSFDDPVAKHLPPNALRRDVMEKVKIKHLLSHTSGLGSYFTPAWDSLSRARFRTVDDWMALVKNDTLAFEPGTRWSYSNTGMLVLGKVIEQASGQSYFDYVREHIYKPAGMTNTDAYELDRVNRNLAVGYDRRVTPDGVEWRNNLFMHVIRGGPAGGGYSTVEDLHRFAVALRSGKLVGKQYVQLLTTPKPELHSPQYGFGFGMSAGGKIVGHSGGFPGISSNLDLYLDGGYTVAVMSNYSGGSMPVVEKARSLLLAGTTVGP